MLSRSHRRGGVVLARPTLRPGNAANSAAQGFAPSGPKQPEYQAGKKYESHEK